MRLSQRLDNLLFHSLLISCLCATTYIGSRYALTVDVTREARNSLSAHSIAILERLQEPTTIELYAGRSSPLVQAGHDLAERYSRESPFVQFKHIDIDRDPHIARDMEISGHGDVVLRMGGQHHRSQALTEAAISGAIESLLIAETRRAFFVTGHGERRATGMANHHYGEFARRLQERGYVFGEINLQLESPATQPGDILVIASAQTGWQPEDTAQLRRFIAQGGDVLWMIDDENSQGNSEALKNITGLERLPGIIVDAASEALGLTQPDFAIVTEYSQHASTRGIDGISLFPRAVAFSAASLNPGWRAEVMLQSTARSWNETGTLAGHIAPDTPGEQEGPLPFAWRLEHENLPGTVTVIGDGDFLANSWLGNGVNLALGERLFDSLTSATPTVSDTTPARDRNIVVSPLHSAWLGGSLFGALPLTLFTIAFLTWRRQTY